VQCNYLVRTRRPTDSEPEERSAMRGTGMSTVKYGHSLPTLLMPLNPGPGEGVQSSLHVFHLHISTARVRVPGRPLIAAELGEVAICPARLSGPPLRKARHGFWFWDQPPKRKVVADSIPPMVRIPATVEKHEHSSSNMIGLCSCQMRLPSPAPTESLRLLPGPPSTGE
jgi:hypothetical protein